jgi:hypothetical protein
VQGWLHGIYRVEAPRVGDFLCGREAAARAGHEVRAGEELLVLEEADGLWLGLHLDEAVVAGALRGDLPALVQVVEGVSHFVFLASRAAAGRPVSLLELEAQAEVDKFALLLLIRWRFDRRRRSRALRRRLFERVGYLGHLAAEELTRYREANRLGAGYARFLEGRYVDDADVEGLLRELRRSYRLGAGEKLAYLDARPLQ